MSISNSHSHSIYIFELDVTFLLNFYVSIKFLRFDVSIPLNSINANPTPDLHTASHIINLYTALCTSNFIQTLIRPYLIFLLEFQKKWSPHENLFLLAYFLYSFLKCLYLCIFRHGRIRGPRPRPPSTRAQIPKPGNSRFGKLGKNKEARGKIEKMGKQL